jgi:4-amino-4-deoxy-L-arabinose transferase-like glycosyltransferase
MMMNSWRNRALTLVGIIAAWRITVMGLTGLGDAEAYYWAWSQELDWSYYDHPPVTAWLIRLFTEIGGDSVFMTRLPSLLLFIASCYLLYIITVKLFKEERAGFWALVVLNLCPIFAVGTLQILPDLPVLFFWLLFVHFMIRVLEEDRPHLWYVIGAVTGVALLSKYMAVLLIPSTLLMLAWHKEYRKHLKQPHIYLGGVLGLAIFSPVIFWNYTHKFSSFAFHLQTRHDISHSFDPHFALLALGGQILYYSPIMWAIMLYISFDLSKRILLRKESDLKLALPFWFSVPSLVFFMLITFWTDDSEPHWTSLAYLMLFSVWGWYYINGNKFFQRMTQLSVLFSALLVGVFYVQMLVPVLPIDDAKYDITNELYGWDEAKEEILKEYEQLPGDNKFILANHYLLGGQLSFALKGHAPVAVITSETDEYDFFEDNIAPIGSNFIYVGDERFKRTPDHYYNFDRCEAPTELNIYRGKKWARMFYFYKCYDYQGEKVTTPKKSK